MIHHLNGLEGCTAEAFRLLKPGGTFIVQDRTPEDCLLPGTDTHIRVYFFEKAPKLIEKEIKRRFSSEKVIEAIENAGFSHVEEVKLWEMRKHYSSVGELSEDLRKRTGRSILFEMNNEKLEQLISYIETRLRADQEIKRAGQMDPLVCQKREWIKEGRAALAVLFFDSKREGMLVKSTKFIIRCISNYGNFRGNEKGIEFCVRGVIKGWSMYCYS
ncbi:hypothetical protein [Fictibacillus sp. NRS-1165]|uniref:hypothetical protein n=1 Tax=Fictibacillus sp. NRS-1165 TaxID=3144463 RepID=UPI003D1C61A2